MPIKRKFIYEAVIQLYRQGISPKAIALQSGVPLTTVRRWICQYDPAYRDANIQRANALRKLKDHETRAIVALRRKDMAPSQIASQLQYRLGRVNRLLADFSARHPDEAAWPSLGEAKRLQMTRYRAAGMSMKQIAVAMGLSKSTVHWYLKGLGLDGPIARRYVGGTAAGNRTARGRPRRRKTGKPAEHEVNTLLMYVAEHTAQRIKPIYPPPDDRQDILLMIDSHNLLVQVRPVILRDGHRNVSILRANGEPYRADTCDLLFGYDKRTHTLYCRLGRDVWTRNTSIAMRDQDVVTRGEPQKLVELIEQALADRLAFLKGDAS